MKLSLGSAGGTETIRYINVTINNFLGNGIDGKTVATDWQFCNIESDSRVKNIFGNYWASSLIYYTDGCAPTFKATLPDQFTGTLPILCGSELLDDVNLDTDLKNNTPGLSDWTCPTLFGLFINTSGVELNCDDHEIKGYSLGAGVFSTADNVNIHHCKIDGTFLTAGILYNGSNVDIHDNFINSSSIYGGISAAQYTTGSDIYANEISGNLWGIYTNYTVNSRIYDNTIHDNYVPLGNIGAGIGLLYTNTTRLYRNRIYNHPTAQVWFVQSTNNSLENNTIRNSTGGVGIYVQTTNYTLVAGNNVSESMAGELWIGGNPSIGNNITRNILNHSASTGYDLNITVNPTQTVVYLNEFIGTGVLDASGANYCFPGPSQYGNFYKYTVIPHSGDCGPIGYANITEGLNFYNISSFDVGWKSQDSALPNIMYYVDVFNDSDDQYYPIYFNSLNKTTFNTVGVLANTSFNFSINPWDGFVNGTYNYTTNFTVTNDLEPDGFSVLDSYKLSDSWDCNDTNASVHQSKSRENDTSSYYEAGIGDGRTFCYNAVDDDCDVGISGYTTGGIDWLDNGCGHGFNPSPFDATLYINGTLDNISTSHIKGSGSTPGSYYVLINDSTDDGMIEYSTETNLTGVNLGSVFSISHNYISGNPDAYDKRFNKTARITFKGLATRYKKVPIVLVDGVICPPEICTGQQPDLGPYSVLLGTLSFTASHFSTFTTANNSRMEIFTQNDSKAGTISDEYPAAIETYHRIKFFANYTRYTDGLAINNKTNSGYNADVRHNGTCYINLIMPGPAGTPIAGTENSRMEYDDYYGVYWYASGVRNFTLASDYYKYNISCNSSLYEPLNLTGTFKVTEDHTEPIRPILYPQILLYPSNVSTSSTTDVAGYFGESDINFTIVVLHGIYSYLFDNSNHDESDLYSEYKGEDLIVNFDARRGENITFTSWTPEIERALQHFRYVEFSNHDRKYFNRYNISRANRTGDDIRIEFYDYLETDVPAGTTSMYLFTTSHPSGHFRVPVSLFPGTNRIAVWGVDQAGNGGNASTDWINAPYPTTPPAAPELWPLPEATKFDLASNLSVIGFINDSAFSSLNMTINFVQGYNFSIVSDFISYTLNATCNLTDLGTWGVGNTTFNVTNSYCSFGSVASLLSRNDVWLNFTNHSQMYQVTGIRDEGTGNYSVNVSPALVSGIDGSLNVSFFIARKNVNFRSSYMMAEAPAYSSVPQGNAFFYISSLDYDRIGSGNFTGRWVELSNHNRTYWQRYEITSTIKNPGEPARIYVLPNLEQAVDSTVQAYIYNSSLPNGWFNISVNHTRLWNGSNTVYALAIRNGFVIPIEGFPSALQSVYQDITYPQFNLSGIPSYSPIETPVFSFNVSDDYKVDISTLLVNVTNISSGLSKYYAYNSSVFSSLTVQKNISCSDLLSNKSLYECVFELNNTQNGTYDVNVSVYDLAGLYNSSNKSMIILVTTIDVLSVLDEDDITNDLWLYFNWTANEGELEYYEFALGTAPYPEAGYASVKAWNNSRDVLGNYQQRWINFTHDRNASDINSTELNMTSGTVYYLTVRARNHAGEYGQVKSSDGILFIDPTPPQPKYIDDHGPWSNSRTKLTGNWLFEDNESDIIEYTYTLGNATYPNPGYNSVAGPVLVTSNSVINDGLSLTENGTYYYSVKARNGNVAMNYSGSWSGWFSSSGVQIDTYPPYGGFIRWQNFTYATSGFVTIWYKVGYDFGSGNVKGLIEVGRGVLDHDVCQPVSDFDLYNISDVLTGESYRDVNVTSGYCYVFRLHAWDNASNGVKYYMQNETLRVVKADTTPPSGVAPVIDDGFYTNSRSSLHARWTASTDAESGFDHYAWRIIEQPVAGFPFCVVNTTYPVGTNCSQVASGNSTTAEISINDLNLTHNHKYYFEVTAWNKANLSSNTTYSDGIIYLDNAPPGDLIILWINDANHSGSPYYTTLETNEINVTAVGDLDGYNDIDNCVLLNDNIDYTESGPFAVNCSEYPHSYYYNETYPNVTYISCTRNTTASLPQQGTWSWYLSCRDHYWNTNTFTQNHLVWFTVDWPEPPVITIDLLPVQAYAGDDIECKAVISDPEDDLNFTNITFTWYRNDAVVATHYSSASDPDLDGLYISEDYLSYAYTSRGNNINCTVSAADQQGKIGINSSAVTIRNTQPYSLSMLLPNAETVHKNMSFSWWGPFDDVDADFMTLEIQVDDETQFNYSNNPFVVFDFPVQLTVGGISIPGTQRNADVYGTKMVYEDNRAGGSWDIYMYDTLTDEETSIATSANQEINPKIYGDFIIYERDLGSGMSQLYMHNLSSSVTTLLVSSINTSSADLFGNYITYNNGSKVVFKDIRSIGTAYPAEGSSSNASKTVVYGKNILWLNSDGTAYIYDVVNSSILSLGGTAVNAVLFGSRAVLEDTGGNIVVINLFNTSDIFALPGGSNVSIYGGLLAYQAAGSVNVWDLLGSTIVSFPIAGNNPEIYDKIMVFEDGNDLYYSMRSPVLPATFIVESPASSSYVYIVNTLLSPDATYVWRIKGCDNAFASNSCVWGLNSTSIPNPLATNFTYFTIDNTPPVISSVSPAQGSVVAGQFRVSANIIDNLGADAVTYANYSLTYRNNGTVRSSGALTRSGTVWSSPLLNFLDINVSDFTLIIMARDTMYNPASASVNFTVNNNTPWFLFGTGLDEMTVDGQKVFNTTIDSDFVAFTVLTSTIRIVGPLPATTQRFIQSKTNLTVTNHNYSDTISTLTWPDGSYRAEFTGTNLDGTNTANRTFFVDRNFPSWSGNRTIPSVAYAASPLTLSINWSDTTLRQVNITHNNSNISNPAQVTILSNTTSSGVFNVTAIDVSAYINKTFYWYSTAVDGLGRVNTTTPIFEAFINDNPPSFAGTIPAITVNEDNFTTSGLPNLSAYFSDPNVGGANGLDNLTFTATYDPTNLLITINATTGVVRNVSVSNNFNGNITVVFNATDYYGKMNYSNNVTIIVNPVNDAPIIAAIPDVFTEEDNSSGINYTLSATDVDGDTVTWLMPENVNGSVFNLTSYNLTTGRFNFTFMPDQFGVYNITFKATDGTLIARRNATINITNVNDIPLIGNFTAPVIGTNNSGSVWLSWSAASDQPNEGQTMNYNIDYSTDGGLSWTNIAPYATLLDSLAYSWDTSLMTTRVNVTLRLNVTDGLAMNYTEYGNFSVDNQKPTITINSPTTIMVGPWFITNIVTSEPASCIFTYNGSMSIVPPTTTLTTLHAVNISGYAYDRAYNLTVSCTDSSGNSNFTSKLFEPRSSALSFIRAYASPSWLYQNQPVNITLEIASNSTWDTVLIGVDAPSGLSQSLTRFNFTPQIDASNKVTSLNGLTSISTSAIGKYNLSINSLWNIDGIGVAPPPILIQDLFEVFEAVNQTLNIE